MKVKLLGFFMLMCFIFLSTLIVTFLFLEQNQFKENALKETSLATHEILHYIQKQQVKAEVIVSMLSSIHENILEDISKSKTLIPTILNAPLYKDMHLQSAGIWFEPYTLNKEEKDHMIFFDRDKKNKFYCANTYTPPNKMNYRDMTFYKLGKTLQDNQVIWTNVYTDPVTHIRMVTVISPIYHHQKFIGVASLDLKIDNQDEVFWSKLNSADMYLILMDKKGTFIGKSSTLNTFISEKNIYHVNDTKIKNLIKIIKPSLDIKSNKNHNNVIEKNIYTLKYDPLLNDKTIVATYYLPSTHWYIIIGIKEAKVMAQYNETFNGILLLIIILTLIATVLGYIILQIMFVRPIESINKQLTVNLNENKLNHALLECHDKGELGTLVHNLNERTQSLEISKANEAKEIEKRLQNEKLLIQQSKMAAMGEMMDAVAHQWKQPLNALSMYSDLIKSDYTDGNIDEKYITQFSEDIQTQIDHMVNTLDEFRTFFRPNKENQTFQLSDVITSVLLLSKDDLLKNGINVSIEDNDPLSIIGSENEFKHLVLNIISNAKDAFNENEIKKRNIKIRIIQDKISNRLEIEDNAGGIPESIIKDIFKANITSKDEGKGTGIGLYMSTQIATKHHASLSVKNQNDGACFTVTF